MSLKGSPIRRLELFGRENAAQATENVALTVEIEKLNALIHAKNIEIKQLLDENKLLKLNYDDQIHSYQKTIELLEKQLKDVEISRKAEFQVIKEKYDKIQAEEAENIRSYHSHQMEFLLKEVSHLRIDIEAKGEKVILKDKQFNSMKESYQREIQEKITEINNLNRSLLAIEEYKNKEIRDLSTKRELERSRTSGIVSSRKENNQFMDKQLRKLNEDVLEKSIKVQNLNRELTKVKRKYEENQKIYSKKIDDLLTEKEEQSKEREQYFAKIEKALKDELLDLRARELDLMSEIDRQKDQIESLKSEEKRNQEAIKFKEDEIKGYKDLIEKQREDHAKEISGLMERKKKSSSRIGSSRSLNSSLKGDGTSEDPMTPIPLKQTESARLPTVREESPDRSPNHSLERSGITEQAQEEDDNELARAVYHYDALIDELKRSHVSEIELLKHKMNKTGKNLEEKQQELLDILTRFSPLVKIHAEEKSIEQDRKERIERHWKADLALLEIMLKKYKIKAYE